MDGRAVLDNVAWVPRYHIVACPRGERALVRVCGVVVTTSPIACIHQPHARRSSFPRPWHLVTTSLVGAGTASAYAVAFCLQHRIHACMHSWLAVCAAHVCGCCSCCLFVVHACAWWALPRMDGDCFSVVQREHASVVQLRGRDDRGKARVTLARGCSRRNSVLGWRDRTQMLMNGFVCEATNQSDKNNENPVHVVPNVSWW